MIDKDKFSIYPYLDPHLRSFTIDAGPNDRGRAARSTHERRPLPRRSPRPSGWTRSACSRPTRTREAASASSGTTATTSSPSRPGVDRRLRAQRHHEHLPAQERHRGGHHRRQRARPRPWRPALHVLPDRARRRSEQWQIMCFQPANRTSSRSSTSPRRSCGTCSTCPRDLKRAKYAGTEVPRLKGKNIALIFEKTSTRTRCAFEVAAHDQGAHVTFLDPGSPDGPQGVGRRTPPACSAGCTTRSSTAAGAGDRRDAGRATPACRCGTA